MERDPWPEDTVGAPSPASFQHPGRLHHGSARPCRESSAPSCHDPRDLGCSLTPLTSRAQALTARARPLCPLCSGVALPGTRCPGGAPGACLDPARSTLAPCLRSVHSASGSPWGRLLPNLQGVLLRAIDASCPAPVPTGWAPLEPPAAGSPPPPPLPGPPSALGSGKAPCGSALGPVTSLPQHPALPTGQPATRVTGRRAGSQRHCSRGTVVCLVFDGRGRGHPRRPPCPPQSPVQEKTHLARHLLTPAVGTLTGGLGPPCMGLLVREAWGLFTSVRVEPNTPSPSNFI